MNTLPRKIFLILALFSALAIAQQAEPTGLSEPREAKFAERVVMNELVRALSQSSVKKRQDCGAPCVESGALELGILLIGVAGESSTPSLMRLLSLRLDGAGSEELGCQLLKRGPRIQNSLNKLEPDVLSAWCKGAFAEALKRDLADIRDVTSSQVCRSPYEIKKMKEEFATAIREGTPCDE